MQPSDVYAVHSAVPGRARFHVTGLRRSEKLKSLLEKTLIGGGISSVTASRTTGTALVTFDSSIGVAGIAELIRRTLQKALAEPIEPQPADLREGDWHKIGLDEAFDRLESRPTGLTEVSARERLARDGPNVIAAVPPRSAAEILLGQVQNVPVAVLGAGAVLSVATGGIVDALVILGVIAINATIGFKTESRAEATINALSDGGLGPCCVLRDGSLVTLPGEEIVPGDILELRAGLLVPADGRLIACDGLTVSEAVLTGESVPVAKKAERLPFGPTQLPDRTNMIFRGTIITGGTGRALIVATGSRTELGQIQTSIGALARPETPMQVQLGLLGRQLVILSLGACGVIFAVGLLRGQALLPMLKMAVSLAIAAVPEGLPTLATTTLAFGIEDLRRRGVLIRRLPAVEGLSSIQVICFDKTGTLTLNRMSVAQIATCTGGYRFADGVVRADGQDEGSSVDLDRESDLSLLLELCALCNDADLVGKGPGFDIVGSPTEAALVEVACAAGLPVRAIRERKPRTHVVERSERRSYMATTHADGKSRLVAVKGSPDDVLGLCQFVRRDGGQAEMTKEARQEIRRVNRRLAAAGLRVLGVASGEGEPRDLTWVGLIALADPLRPDARRIIESFHRAGISTLMITGDQPATAKAIAEQLGLRAVAERHIEALAPDPNLSRESAAEDLLATHIFARVTPAQKLSIIQRLQGAGLVIAMTGDGVNDAPSLRAADIGIALGGGTDAARQTADVILLGDELAGLITALERGRATYDNIRRAIRYLLATNLGEMALMFAVTASGVGQPLTPVQLLWVNLVTDVLPAIGLALDVPAADLMERPPRSPSEPIIPARDFWTLGLDGAVIAGSSLAAQAISLARHGPSPRAGAVGFTSLVAAQLFYALRSPNGRAGTLDDKKAEGRPPYLPMAVGLSFAAQFAALFIPGLRRLCGGPIDLVDTGIALGTGMLPLLLSPSNGADAQRTSRVAKTG